MKRTLLVLLLSVLYAEIFAQCHIAQTYQDVDSASTVELQTDGQHLLIQEKKICLAGAKIQDSLPCFPAGTRGISVWYKITTEASEGVIYSSVGSNTGIKPVWQFYFEAVTGEALAVQECSNEGPLDEVLNYDFRWDNNYFIHVQLPYEETPSEEDSLTVRLALLPYPYSEPCNNVTRDGQIIGDVNVTITERQHTGLPDEALLPGEEVTVEVLMDLDMSNINDGNVHSILPILGDGWDHNYFYDQDQFGKINTTTGTWLTSRSDCSGRFNVGTDVLCTYLDDEYHVRICNKLVEHCPCSDNIQAGDRQPAGWYFVQQGFLLGCSNSCLPSERVAAIGEHSRAFVRLKLRVAHDAEGKDLSIRLQPTSDHFTGCNPVYENFCEYQVPIVLQPFTVVANNEAHFHMDYPWTVCNNDSLEIELIASGVEGENVRITFSTNNDINGVPSWPVTMAADRLLLRPENTSGEIQEIKFSVNATTNDGKQLSQGPFHIEVLPDLALRHDSFEICAGGCAQVKLQGNWQNRRYLQFDWSTGEVGPEIDLCDNNEYFVTVTDESNCDVLMQQIFLAHRNNTHFDITGGQSHCGSIPSLTFNMLSGDGSPTLVTKWQLLVDGSVLITRTNRQSFTVALAIVNNVNFATVRAEFIASGGCRLEVERDIEIFHDLVQQPDLMICTNNEPIKKTVRLTTTLNSPIAEVMELEETPHISSVWNGQDSLTLYIDVNGEPSDCYAVLLRGINGKEQLATFDIDYHAGSQTEIDYDITDFEVDFSIPSAAFLDSIRWSFGDGRTSSELFPSVIYPQKSTYEVQAILYSSCGIDTIYAIVIVSGTATADLTLPHLTVYPNPACRSIALDGAANYTGTYQLFVHDLTGRLLYDAHTEHLSDVVIDVSDFITGTYLLSIVGAEGRWQEKVVVMND